MLHLPIERQAHTADQPIDHPGGVVLCDLAQLGIPCCCFGLLMPQRLAITLTKRCRPPRSML